MKKILLSLATASLLFTTNVCAKSSVEVSNETLKQAKQDAKNSQVELVKEAVTSLMLTNKVLEDLDKKDSKTAIKDLEDAIGKLEVILASEKVPTQLVVDSKVVAIEYLGDSSKIKKDLDFVKNLLNNGKVQEARMFLNTLQSQINILTVSIPLASYPDALKLAAKYLHNKKEAEARTILETALNTLVEEKIVLPIPILKAEGLIKAASLIAKNDKNQALKHLDQAKDELKVAQILGYVSKSDTTYKMLSNSINDIETEIKGKNKAKKLFDELIDKLKEFKEKAVKTFDKENKEK